MVIRILSGTVRNAHGDPWADFELQFVVSPMVDGGVIA